MRELSSFEVVRGVLEPPLEARRDNEDLQLVISNIFFLFFFLFNWVLCCREGNRSPAHARRHCWSQTSRCFASDDFGLERALVVAQI